MTSTSTGCAAPAEMNVGSEYARYHGGRCELQPRSRHRTAQAPSKTLGAILRGLETDALLLRTDRGSCLRPFRRGQRVALGVPVSDRDDVPLQVWSALAGRGAGSRRRRIRFLSG